MATSYTSNKKIGALDSASTPLAATNEIVINQNGDTLKTPLSAVEAKVFDAKTAVTNPSGSEVVVVRQTDNTLRQVALSDIVPALNITNAKVSASAAIEDTKLATINTAGKVTNNAVQATSTNTASRIVARDGSGNFSAGTITATLSGNASTATTASTATALATGRTIAMTGDVTYTSPAFNGTANVTAAATLANSGVVAGTYNNVESQVRPFTVDAKGRVTAVGAAVPIKIDYSALNETTFKDSVRLATTGNLTATYSSGALTLTNSGTLGVLSIDGVSVVSSDRILVKDQTNSVHNGIYTVTNTGSSTVAWVLTRSDDASASLDLFGAVVAVLRGNENGGKLFTTSFKSPSVLGTDANDWHQVVTTGDSGTVSTAMIAANAVDNTKIRDSAALSVIGRSANSTGDPADIAAGTDGHALRRSGTTLGFGQIVEAGIADNAVTNAKFRDSAGLSVIGRSASTTGGVADITAASDFQVLRRSGSSIGFGTISGTAAITPGTITNASLSGACVQFTNLLLPANFPIQVVQAVKTNTQTIETSASGWVDISGLSVTLTRRIPSATGAVRVQASVSCGNNNNSNVGVMLRIVRGSTAIGVGDSAGSRKRVTGAAVYAGAHSVDVVHLDFIDDSPGSTSTVTYKIQARSYSTTTGFINRSSYDTDDEDYGLRAISTLTLTELAP